MLSKSKFKGMFDEHLTEDWIEKLWEVYEGLETRGVLLTAACVCRDQNGNVFTVYRCSSATWSDGCDFYDEHGEPENTDSAPIVEIIKTLTDQEILDFQRGAVSVDPVFQVGDWVLIHKPVDVSDIEEDCFILGMEKQFDMVGQVVEEDGGVLQVKVPGETLDFWWHPAYLSPAPEPVPQFKPGDKVWLVDKGPTEHSYYGWVGEMDRTIMDRLTVVRVCDDGAVRLSEIAYTYHSDSFIKSHPEAGDWDKGIAESAYDHGLMYLGTLTESAYWTHDEDLFVYIDGDWELTTDLREPNKHYAYQERP